ncbi:ORF10 [Choristoneura fumiferana granulovirus]|uniref:ORF10 n=1 Tax=Choristoneura fumiferana granulovirus TaxID=56947 RepID=Q8JL57_GVCF|nr:ORF10 [Choristoneura fumiferana granulovirus]
MWRTRSTATKCRASAPRSRVRETVLKPSLSTCLKSLRRSDALPPTRRNISGANLALRRSLITKTSASSLTDRITLPSCRTYLTALFASFVLCRECDNPETELIVSTKRNTISQGCKACGYHGKLDLSHKLNTFILKNPPPKDPSTQGSSQNKSNRGKRFKRSKPDADNNDVKPESKVVAESRHEKKIDYDDGIWTVDVSEAAVRARMQNLTESTKSMTLNEDMEKNQKQRLDLFYVYLKQKHTSGDVSEHKVAADLLHEAERLKVKSKAPLVLFEVLVRPAALACDVRKYRALLLRFTQHDPRAQRAVLTALCVLDTALLPKVAGALKLLYDLDIVQEKTIMEWFHKPSCKTLSKEVMADVHRRAQPFLNWLQQAEDDSSDSAEELEIEYSDRAAATRIKAVLAPPRPKNDDAENDIDIDAI